MEALDGLQEMNTSEIVSKVVCGALPLFYLVPPSRSSFRSISEVPNYVEKVRVDIYMPRPHYNTQHIRLVHSAGHSILFHPHIS